MNTNDDPSKKLKRDEALLARLEAEKRDNEARLARLEAEKSENERKAEKKEIARKRLEEVRRKRAENEEIQRKREEEEDIARQIQAIKQKREQELIEQQNAVVAWNNSSLQRAIETRTEIEMMVTNDQNDDIDPSPYEDEIDYSGWHFPNLNESNITDITRNLASRFSAVPHALPSEQLELHLAAQSILVERETDDTVMDDPTAYKKRDIREITNPDQDLVDNN